MTIQGIDIASYQAGIDTTGGTVPLDFVIVKATQGTGYVNPDCARAVDQALNAGKAVGVYHYIDGAAGEADFFCDQISGWVGRALICLDWEPGSNGRWGDEGYLGEVIDRVRARTGRPPVVYASFTAFPWQVCADRDCGTWVAQYADMNPTGYQDHPWNEGAYACLIRQYSSTGRLSGWGGDLDLDIFYGDRSAWDSYVAGTNTTTQEEDMGYVDDISDQAARKIAMATMGGAGAASPMYTDRLDGHQEYPETALFSLRQRIGVMIGELGGRIDGVAAALGQLGAGQGVDVEAVKAAAADGAKAAVQAVIDSAEPGTAPAAALAANVHIVAAGETLRGIAAQANVDMSTIVGANPGLEPNRMVAGQRITIPTTNKE